MVYVYPSGGNTTVHNIILKHLGTRRKHKFVIFKCQCGVNIIYSLLNFLYSYIHFISSLYLLRRI